MSAFLFSCTLFLLLAEGILGFFGKPRICEDDLYKSYQRIGEVLANDTAPNPVSKQQLENATKLVTGNSTFEPLCTQEMLFRYEYGLKERNVQQYGLLAAELEALAKQGTICDCKIPRTAFSAIYAISKLGGNSTKEAIQSVLQTYGYTDHHELYANCRVVGKYLPLITSYMDITEEIMEKKRLDFEAVGEILLEPMLSKSTAVPTSADSLDGLNTGMKLLGNLPTFQPMASVFRKFVDETDGNPFSLSHECAIYRSSAATFAAKGEAVGTASLQEMRDTLERETGNPRVRSTCLNYFLEEYWRNGLKLNSSTPYYIYRMVENIFRGDQLSTVSDLDSCDCPIPTMTKKLVADLVGLGSSPDLNSWNEVCEKYGFIGWAISYDRCPVLEWYLEGIKNKFGPAATKKRFLEVGFNLALAQSYLANKRNWL